jgi:hypothetical protein
METADRDKVPYKQTLFKLRNSVFFKIACCGEGGKLEFRNNRLLTNQSK